MNYNAITASYPTEAEARASFGPDVELPPYRGIWRMPSPYGATEVHVFSDDTAEQLEAEGGELVQAPGGGE